MARDHRKLRVYHEAHQLVLGIYRETGGFPREEWYGLRAQMRRAAVSVASNIVEGSARRSGREYVSFLNIARASAGEVDYFISLAAELHYLSRDSARALRVMAETLIPQLEALIQSMESLQRTERGTKKLRPRA